jgi:protein-arginine kinase activator protein McsA
MNIEKTPQPQEEAGESSDVLCAAEVWTNSKKVPTGLRCVLFGVREQIEPLLKRIHGRTVHTGKIAKTGGKELKVNAKFRSSRKIWRKQSEMKIMNWPRNIVIYKIAERR